MENSIDSISLEIRKTVSDLSHGGVTSISEMHVIDVITDKLVNILDNKDSSEVKKALRNMFILGQLHK